MYSILPKLALGILSYVAKKVSHLEGDMAEFGVFKGGSAKIISEAVPNKKLHLFDNFDGGLPESDAFDVGHKKGEMACPLEEVKEYLKDCNVEYHPGIFPASTSGLENLRFNFVYVDADIYQSIKDAISFFLDRIVDGGIMIFDDAFCIDTPGVKKALEELPPEYKTNVLYNFVYICKNQEMLFDDTDILRFANKLFPCDDVITISLLNREVDKNIRNFFQLHENRIEIFKDLKKNFQVFPEDKKWKGEYLDGKTILLVSEQGVGDNIQYLRYAKLLKKFRCSILIMNGHLTLSSLLECQEYIDAVFNKKVPYYDYWCPLISLPAVLRCVYIDKTPYMEISDNGYDFPKDKTNVGIVWAGTPMYGNDRNRSCPLKEFKPLFDNPRLKIWSFQADKRARAYHDNPSLEIDLADHPPEWEIIDFGVHIKSWYDTALFLKNLDVLVSVDTGILHLAGAMGIPSIAVMNYVPCWRWGATSKSPWYENMSIVRQKSPGDWKSVFEEVAHQLNTIDTKTGPIQSTVVSIEKDTV